MRYYGIKTIGDEPFIWWISNSEFNAWAAFFQFPAKDGTFNAHRVPLDEAIAAYSAIGNRCVELEVKEKNA